jgi:hypothetical protein
MGLKRAKTASVFFPQEELRQPARSGAFPTDCAYSRWQVALPIIPKNHSNSAGEALSASVPLRRDDDSPGLGRPDRPRRCQLDPSEIGKEADANPVSHLLAARNPRIWARSQPYAQDLRVERKTSLTAMVFKQRAR